MSQLKPGMKVRVKSEYSEISYLDPTKTYTVLEANGPIVKVEDPETKKPFIISENILEIIQALGWIQTIIRLILKIIGK